MSNFGNLTTITKAIEKDSFMLKALSSKNLNNKSKTKSSHNSEITFYYLSRILVIKWWSTMKRAIKLTILSFSLSVVAASATPATDIKALGQELDSLLFDDSPVNSDDKSTLDNSLK